MKFWAIRHQMWRVSLSTWYKICVYKALASVWLHACVLFLVHWWEKTGCLLHLAVACDMMYGQPSCCLSSLSETWVPSWTGATGWMGSSLLLRYWFLWPAGLALPFPPPTTNYNQFLLPMKTGGMESEDKTERQFSSATRSCVFHL